MYRYLAAAQVWTESDPASAELAPASAAPTDGAAVEPRVLAHNAGLRSAAEVRVWARLNGIEVPDRGRLRPDVIEAWRRAHGA